MKSALLSSFFLLIVSIGYSQIQSPNIVLIIADDLGIDVIEGFGIEGEKPITPTLDSLRSAGITFTNCWATPQCSPSRAAILSGKFGIKHGVLRPPGPLDIEHESLFKKIQERSNSPYEMAAIGKWHLGSNNVNHPADHEVEYFEGFLNSNVEDYYDWTKTTNGIAENVTEYATTHLTTAAINWVNQQNSPWLLWLAHGAPHSPFQAPPSELHITPISDSRSTYFAMIEAMDFEINRLIRSMDDEKKENTLFIFVGDNGTPNRMSEFYPGGHGKGSIYEGGLRVPLIVSGKSVNRIGEIDNNLIHVTDIHSTIMELADIPLPGGEFNSLSFKPLLSCSTDSYRTINYVDYNDDGLNVWATRTNRYKLIEDENGNQEFYDILDDLKEENNLIDQLTEDELNLKEILEEEARVIREGWSCKDGIQNGDEVAIDDCESTCSEIDELSTDNIGCCESPDIPSVYYEYVEGDSRVVYSNTFPNHDYCYANSIPSPVYKLYRFDLNPTLTNEISSVTRDNGRPARFFGIAKNGVIFMPAPALPFIFENVNTGEYNWDWVFEPTVNQGDGRDKVGLDCASAHTNNSGYHYHGNMFEYVETVNPGSSTTMEIPEKPIHIGWASDGFPILYRFGPDSEGNMKEMIPSFQLKKGLRPGDGIEAPCGPHTGKYIADYEYICGKGDLNECNGIESQVEIETSEGIQTFNFYYVITSDYPQIPRCMMGNVSADFDNSARSLQGVDNDGDGFIGSFDCDDNDASINPNAMEIEGNDIDENCDNLLTNTFEIEKAGFKLLPNPNRGTFWIETPSSESYHYELFSINGQNVISKQGRGKMYFRSLSRGTYSLKISHNGAMLGSTRVVVL